VDIEETDTNGAAAGIKDIHAANPGGLLPHRLEVKPGMPVILIGNIDPNAGFCNGTRMIVELARDTLLQCRIVTGTRART
jgi:hypothetical protein